MPTPRSFDIGKIHFGGKAPLFLMKVSFMFRV